MGTGILALIHRGTPYNCQSFPKQPGPKYCDRTTADAATDYFTVIMQYAWQNVAYRDERQNGIIESGKSTNTRKENQVGDIT
jgi:hypothetical protein